MSDNDLAGRILRRGTKGLTNAQLKDLLDNAGKVQAILDDINGHRDVFLETEARTLAQLDELVAKETKLAENEAALVVEREQVAEDKAWVENKYLTTTDVLNRREQEVEAKEEAAQARAEALDARERLIEAHGLTLENELRERETAVEEREKSSDKREQDDTQRAAGLNAREKRVAGVEVKVTRAVDPLRAPA